MKSSRINSFKDIFQTLVPRTHKSAGEVSIPLRIYFKPMQQWQTVQDCECINSFKDIFQTSRNR